jgi:hypothetical protein
MAKKKVDKVDEDEKGKKKGKKNGNYLAKSLGAKNLSMESFVDRRNKMDAENKALKAAMGGGGGGVSFAIRGIERKSPLSK